MQFEAYKSFCADHPYEPITNFCAQKQCLIGLCATCVGLHTDYHMKIGTCPIYENIKDTFGRMNDRLRAQVDKVQSTKQKLDSVCQIITEKKASVRQSLEKARVDCIALVNRHFDELQVKMQTQISSESKKNNLHNQYRMETLNTLILKQISNLLSHANDLNSPNFLTAIKRLELEALPNSDDFFNRVCGQLKQNEVYTASVVYRNEYLAQVKIVLNKLINLEFLLPNMKFVDEGNKQAKMQEQMLQQQQQRQNQNQFSQSRAQSLNKSTTSLNPNNPIFKMLPPTVIDTKTKMSSSGIFKGLLASNSSMFSRQSPLNPNSQNIQNIQNNQSFKSLNDKGKLLTFMDQNSIKTVFENSKSANSFRGETAVTDKENDVLAYSTFLEQNFMK